MVSTMLTTDTISAPRKAGQKPSTVKPMPNWLPISPVSQNIRVLISRVPRPSVKMISGQVRSSISGRSSALISPKISASPTIGSQPLWVSVMPCPCSRVMAAQMATALIAQRKTSRAISLTSG